MNPPRSIPAATALAPRRSNARSAAPLLPAPLARLIGFACLAGFGVHHWGQIVTPAAGGAMAAGLVASLAAGAALVVLARTRRPARERWAAGAVAGLLLLVVALVGSGVPGALLQPRGWDDLAAGIGQGLSAVPSVSVPYGGVEEWTRTVLILGGGALVGASALLAFAPRRDGRFGFPVAAAGALATLYAVPVVQRTGDQPFLAGTAFALLLGVFLWLERVERRSAGLAAALLAAAAVAALATAPRLDAETSLLDYEQLAQSLSSAVTTQYSWDHTYGKLDWPRDGREVLRVRSPVRAYWKATNLTSFDGLRWVQDGRQVSLPMQVATANLDWVTTIRVTVRALSSTQFVAAGETIEVIDSPRSSVRSMPGVLETAGRPLRRGHAYQARVYQPRPSARRLRTAGTDYPLWLRGDYGFMRVPAGRPALERSIAIAFWGAPAAAAQRVAADAAFAASPYAGVYALAQRLRARSETPYEYMRAVERHLVEGFAYSETPPASRLPLADFLLRDRVGYCQQFSGAMALLLRMGGVPARVSAGFAPGVRDEDRKEYVVRDVDAHSWVEVFYPGIGWITRDPTPASSPARSQTADLALPSQASQVALGGTSERVLGGSTDRGRAATQATGGEKDSAGTGRIVGAAVAVVVLVLAGSVPWRRRRGRAIPEDELAELRRALRRSGREPRPDLTLEALARRLGGTPAEGYVRALARARYGYGSGVPTRDERRALRRELGSGLGLRGRLRAWWALPPGAAQLRTRLRLTRRRAVLSSDDGRG